MIEKQNPEVESSLSELNESLRAAVQQVRATPPPQEAIDRALNRAKNLGPPKLQPWRRFVKPAIAAAVAASLFFALSAWFSPPREDSRAVARNNLTQLSLAVVDESKSMVTLSWDGTKLADGDSNTILWSELDDLQRGAARVKLRAYSVELEKLKDHPVKEMELAPKPTPEPKDAFGLIESKKREHLAEAYTPIVENVFLAAQRVPLSTFSVDVSTASYSNVRRFLIQEQRLPHPDAVRVAEMINYFPYTYAQPQGDAPVAFTTNVVDCPWNAKHHLVRVAMKGKQIDPSQLPPRNLVFLIDTSGSMDVENRLPLLKKSLNMLVDQLNDKDRVAIVTYAGSAELALASTPGTDTVAIKKAINDLNAQGSTNGGGGIVMAYKIAKENYIKGGLNRVILGTDGDFNVGVTSQDDLVKLIEEQRKTGVYLTILGYGMGNLKDATMEKLAHHGHGHYAYIDGIMEAKKIFVDQGAALVTIAKDVKLQVEFNPKRVGAYRLIGYENRLMPDKDFHDDTKIGGNIGTGHTVTALYEIVSAGQPVPEPGKEEAKWETTPKPADVKGGDEWLTVKMRYKDPEAETSQLVQQALSGPVVKLADAPTDFRFAAAVASFGLVLRDSSYRGSANYARTLDLAKTGLGDDLNGHRAEFLTLVDTAQTIARKVDAEKKKE